MNSIVVTRVIGAVAVASALALPAACAPYGLGGLDGILGGMTGIEGEVRGASSRQISIRDTRSRTHTLRVDRGTVVVYGDRRYPVSVLERGDWVRATYSTDRSGHRWAERVEVRQNYREGSRRGSVSRLEGRVSGVDTRRGVFRLDRGRSGSLLVYVPPRVSRDDARRFERLRSGQRVRVDVRPISRSEAELVRFR